jgi:hypothetical protein
VWLHACHLLLNNACELGYLVPDFYTSFNISVCHWLEWYDSSLCWLMGFCWIRLEEVARGIAVSFLNIWSQNASPKSELCWWHHTCRFYFCGGSQSSNGARLCNILVPIARLTRGQQSMTTVEGTRMGCAATADQNLASEWWQNAKCATR